MLFLKVGEKILPIVAFLSLIAAKINGFANSKQKDLPPPIYLRSYLGRRWSFCNSQSPPIQSVLYCY